MKLLQMCWNINRIEKKKYTKFNQGIKLKYQKFLEIKSCGTQQK